MDHIISAEQLVWEHRQDLWLPPRIIKMIMGVSSYGVLGLQNRVFRNHLNPAYRAHDKYKALYKAMDTRGAVTHVNRIMDGVSSRYGLSPAEYREIYRGIATGATTPTVVGNLAQYHILREHRLTLPQRRGCQSSGTKDSACRAWT